MAGIWVIDGDNAREHKSIFLATRKPPASPESEIRGPGGLLAESDLFNAKWELTAVGEKLAATEMLTVLAALNTMSDEEEAETKGAA